MWTSLQMSYRWSSLVARRWRRAPLPPRPRPARGRKLSSGKLGETHRTMSGGHREDDLPGDTWRMRGRTAGTACKRWICPNQLQELTSQSVQVVMVSHLQILTSRLLFFYVRKIKILLKAQRLPRQRGRRAKGDDLQRERERQRVRERIQVVLVICSFSVENIT